jgi:hypothetical protein
MSKFIRFTDAVTGQASIRKDFSRDLKTITDSTSPSGQSLIAQIEMTHAGIVTRNSGFYLPDNMRKGAHTFTKNYNKPVLVGHDSDSDPVGRVIQADYVDTSFQYVQNDKYLSSLIKFNDKKDPEKAKNGMVSFVQHVIGEYNSKDSYRGLGHINGTLKITDPVAIQKVLDERYLTVSISMSSDSAYCSECGQDWVSEGQCEHDRGQVYDSGIPVVLIPGKQNYNHVGFVSEPADKFAAGLKGIELVGSDSVKELDSVIQVLDNHFKDRYSIAANLFSYKDSKLISLSDESQTDLFEVKNNIQKLEDSLKPMENEKMKKGKFADDVSASISLYMYGEDGESTSLEFRKYASTLSAEQLGDLAKKAAAALASQESLSEESIDSAIQDYFKSVIPAITDSVVSTEALEIVETENKTPVMKKVKTLSDKLKLVDGVEYDASLEDSILAEIQKIEGVNLTDKEVNELASLIARSQHQDALASLTIETKDKTIKECVEAYVAIKDSRFKLTAVSAEDVVAKMNDHLSEENKLVFDSIVAKDCAGSGKYFPILNKACVEAAKKVLALTISSDSIKGKILENIEKISSKIVVDKVVAEEFVADKTVETTEIFDSTKTECDNQGELNDETLVAELTKLVTLATDRGLFDSFVTPFLAEKELEIGVLEQQLLLANDEVDELLASLAEIKDNSKKDLAEKVVDAKIKSGLFELNDRESEIVKHLERTEDSLNDALADLVKAKPAAQIADGEKIDSPVLTDDSGDLNTQIINDTKVKVDAAAELKKKEVMKTYSMLKINKNKSIADAWLKTQNY